jgi:Uma2 family endonuclease
VGLGMVDLLEKSATRAMVAKLSVAGYQRLYEQGLISGKNELIRGVIIEKMSKSPEHAFAIILLLEKFAKFFANGYCLRKEDPITLADSEPEPDIAVVSGNHAMYAKQHPTMARLIVEISKTTYDLDYDKQFIYAEANIPEYWLVNLEKSEVEVYRRPEAGRYLERTIYSKGKEIPLEGGLINLDEIY